ncbi:MAG: hypothetical protein HON07_11160, partial [Planctomycetaceae bacterium]|nr:hypothetical protein [Planctomycetaceae bacterium]
MKVKWLTVFLASCLISISYFCGQQRLCADNSNAQSAQHVGAAKPTGVEWKDCVLDLVQRADASGDKKLARFISNWPLPDEATQVDAQIIACIDKNTDGPGWLKESSKPLWSAFMLLRQQRARHFFERAKTEIEKQRNLSTRHHFKSSNEATRLLVRAVREDPDHKLGRRALGYVRDDDQWVWPNAARQLAQRKEYSAENGWTRNGKSTMLPSPQSPFLLPNILSPQSTNATELFVSDHWNIESTAGIAKVGDFAERLELTRFIWRQVFGGFVMTSAELNSRINGQARPRPVSSSKAILLANREEYINNLQSLEPNVGKSLGMYWTPTQTTWFFDSPDSDGQTVEHEATHQLFAECWPTNPVAGTHHGIWAMEAAACYMESIEKTDFGFIVGGRNSGRVPAAKERLFNDSFFLPLRKLAKLGRRTLQNEPDLPKIYSQLSGLADFFINGERGRYRDAFVEYLV